MTDIVSPYSDTHVLSLIASVRGQNVLDVIDPPALRRSPACKRIGFTVKESAVSYKNRKMSLSNKKQALHKKGSTR
jgi:hypothetical protein